MIAATRGSRNTRPSADSGSLHTSRNGPARCAQARLWLREAISDAASAHRSGGTRPSKRSSPSRTKRAISRLLSRRSGEVP